jgi:hypothetical protein
MHACDGERWSIDIAWCWQGPGLRIRSRRREVNFAL